MNLIGVELYTLWFIIGFVMLLIELWVLGFATGFLLFPALGALLTGGLLYGGLIGDDWLLSVATFTLLSATISLLLWRPLKRLQGESGPVDDRSSDLIGYRFHLLSELSPTQTSTIRYSGIEWRVELDHEQPSASIEPGSLVEVTSVSAGCFRVAPVVNRPHG
ncbi:NfeD family protein [Ectothiorhodospiraceae bacterium BW-2]|nr:NfeD family protein [Ectothiorhodospiraceae bacterium BW-2]